MEVRGESMRIDLRADQANTALQGLLKSLYGLGFHWVVSRVNEMLREGTGMRGTETNKWAEGTVFLDALDIFGFENFRTNSFEQLCINFANEKLHQLYLLTMFKAEQDVIRLEKVEVPKVDYSDNERCLHMLAPKPEPKPKPTHARPYA